ncbi:MAG: glutamine synthetase family protein [Boseongicola sp.]
MNNWLNEHPEIRSVTVAVADLNGQARGKRMPVSFADKALKGGTRMPLSALNVDICGDDIEDSPLVFETGDRDGVLKPTDRGFVKTPWLSNPAALLPTWMYTDAGEPFEGDPRHALAKVLSRFSERGWQVVAATELEFYLVDDSGETLGPPASPRSGKPRHGGEVLSLEALDAFDGFFTELYDACEAMGIPAETAISESGVGQYEINLTHGPAMKAADDAWLFKLLAKGLARKHEFATSFMAKPYPKFPGTGMHIHFSVVDESGENVFNNGGEKGSDELLYAVGGCLAAMKDQTLIFAPHGNSYERLVPGAHAPTGVGWAYENRTAAIRIPGGPPIARRIEHRVAGGDINPYLMLAAVLGAAITGIEDKIVPPQPIKGNAYARQLDQLPADWAEAIQVFEDSALIPRIFSAELIRNLILTKRQELSIYAELSPQERIDLYLDTV